MLCWKDARLLVLFSYFCICWISRYWLIVRCFTPLSTIFQLYHGVSWVSYQYYWSIYPDTSQSVVMRAPRRSAITTIVKVLWSRKPCEVSRRLSLSQLQTHLDASTGRRLLKTLWQKEKLLIMSNLSFCHYVFNSFQLLNVSLQIISKNLRRVFSNSSTQWRLIEQSSTPFIVWSEWL